MIGSGPGAAAEPHPGDSRVDDGRALVAGLAALHDYADGVAAAAAQLPSGVGALRARVVADATRVARTAREPVTVGVVGPRSAGRSLVLGLLLGGPDLLPVDERPLAADVTAVVVTGAPPGSPTARTTARIDYLTEAELTALVAHMLDELAPRAAEAGLDPEPLRAVRAAHPPARFWAALERWCRTEAWPRGERRLTLLVAELMALRSAVAAAPALLGWSTAVRPDVVDEALRLPAPAADPAAFPRPAPPPATVNRRGGARGSDGPDAAQLRATLPLVRRVTLGVTLPTDVWDLAALHGDTGTVLLDCPGLYAGPSGVRDRWLCRRALQDVTTIVVAIDGEAGDGAVSTGLAADGPGSVLPVPLPELARDGGAAHLRAMLGRHVRAGALRVRHDDLVDDVDRLARDVGRLVTAAQDELGAAAVAARAAARQPVEALLTDVRVAVAELQERAVEDLADPDRFLVGPERTLAAAVGGHAVAEVFAWPEWDRLFDAVEDRVVAVSGGDDIEIDIPGLSGTAAELPLSTAELRPRFDRAVEACTQRSEALAWAAFDAWVRRQDDGLAPLRASYRQVVDDDARRRLAEALGRDDRWTRALDLAVDLAWLPRTVRTYVPGYLARHGALARPAVFPLPPDAWFAWHPGIPDDVRSAMDAIMSRHQVQLARLRRELVNGVAAAVLARIGVVLLGMADGARKALAQPKALVDDRGPFVDALVGEPAGPGDGSLAALRALTPPAVRRTGPG